MEKMQLGSPQNTYLPNFLMGIEQTPTNPHRSFSNSPTASPSSLQQKFLTGLQSPNPIFNSSMNQSSFNHHQQQHFQAAQNQNHPANNSTANNSISGPPINSLFDNLRNELSFQTPTKNYYHQQSHIIHQDTPQPQLNASGFNQSRILSPIPLSFSAANAHNHDFNNSYQNPLQQSAVFANNQSMMNGYTQRDFWVTVFGFPAEALTIVLSHFSGCGTILEKVCSSGNWVHLRYSSRAECDKSLLYNGKIIGNNLMIGVVRCEDESITEKENQNEYPQASISKIRSLTQAAYKSAIHETEVVQSGEEPKKTTGIVNKAMDLIFGW